MPSLNIPQNPLTEAELAELDRFLLDEPDSDEGLTLDSLDGLLHAIAMGPSTIPPSRWLAAVWGDGGSMLPRNVALARSEHIIGLIMRRYNEIIDDLVAESPEISPIWAKRKFQGKEYDDGEMWAYGFIEGMKLSWNDWVPMLDTPEGKAWFRPIGLLAQDDFGADQDELTETPAQREVLSKQMLDSVLAIHAYWLPYRLAVYERSFAKTYAKKVGRNEPCPCGSGKKFKKCCGAAADLH